MNLKATHVDIDDRLRAYIQEKVDMLDKYLGDTAVVNCDVEIGKTVGGQNKGDIYRAEINLRIPREVLRVEKTSSDIFKAIDKVKDHLVEVIVSKREKVRDLKRRRQAQSKAAAY